MTQHHDPVHPDEGDLEPFDELSAADDAYVSALLADLPDVPMPADVRARVDAALAELAPLPVPTTATNVVPIGAAPSRWRNPRILQAAAALVLVVGAGAVGIKAMSGSSAQSTAASGAGAPAAERSDAALQAAVASGTAYTTDSLAPAIRRLVTHGKAGFTAGGDNSAGGASAPSVPTFSSDGGHSAATEARALAANQTRLAQCLIAIEDSADYTDPLAIDAATYNGQSALVVVLPNPDDTKTYAVWIVQPTCGVGGDAHLISFVAVPRA